MEKAGFYVLRDICENGMSSVRNISKRVELSLGTVSNAIKSLKEEKFLSDNGVLSLGKKELQKYQVRHAIIMAAGPSTRLAPLSFDKPKGLFEVRDEILIERQIKQLIDAGIEDIIIVLGYKKESFFYLGEKYNLKIVINPLYNIKNNSETLYLVRDKFVNSYICSCDQYFTINPFHRYEYESFYTAIDTKVNNGEPHIIEGHNDEIASKDTSKLIGVTLLGFAYFDIEFATAFSNLLEKNHESGEYDKDFWENVYFKNIKNLPPLHISRRPIDTIFEFDNIDQLRKFDNKYIKKTSFKIMNHISDVLNCGEGEIVDFKPIKEGMTNTSYTFVVRGKKYVYRHPGDGTEKIIKRLNEKQSLILAKELGVDPSYIMMDEKEGWKISSFIENTRSPDYSSLEDSKIIVKKMRQLHDSNRQVDWRFEPWDDAILMENQIKKVHDIEMPDFKSLKDNIHILYQEVENDNLVHKCFCHCDTYKFNWLIKEDNKDVVLIDWEYSGYADPGVDVGYYIVDAMYDFDEAKQFIKLYLGNNYSLALEKHFMFYVAIIAYYWFVWAMFRESCGAVMGESLYNWYYMAKKYSTYLIKEYYGK